MQLEVGKYYRTRDGRKVGPVVLGFDADRMAFKWAESRNDEGAWNSGGNYGLTRSAGPHDLDLITEWGEEPEAQPAGPVRTITRREIVPGAYGEVVVDDDGDVRVGYMRDAATIRAAIATLTEIADAMEENSK